jgi:hypothetical protein
MSARCEVSEQKQMAKPKEATRGSYDEDVLFEKQEGQVFFRKKKKGGQGNGSD